MRVKRNLAKRNLAKLTAVAGLAALGFSGASAQNAKPFSGVACASPPVLHCPATNCASEIVTANGSAAEAKTGRPYFLDFPCDLAPGEKVTFILSLHGGDSYANWQRHYFPAVDFVASERLVVANVTTRPAKPRWDATDDQYLRNVVDYVVSQVGKDNISGFWLAGHSNGGLNIRRIICDDYFKTKVDGFLSLSGGRVGGAAPNAPGAGRPQQNGRSAPNNPPAGTPAPGAPGGPGGADPACDFSHIYATGEHEVTEIPAASTVADKFGCQPRIKMRQIADGFGGYVYDGTNQNPATPQWGREPKGGRVDIYSYRSCRDGRVVMDFMRMDKGHTEGLENNVTEQIIRAMKSARGGALQRGG